MKQRRGFTLVEAMVGVGVLSLLLVVLVEAIMWGLRAHRKGEAARQAQTVARTALDRITQEMSTGVSLDSLFPDQNHPRDFLSAVVWPDPYKADSGNHTIVAFTPASVYARTQPTIGGVEADVATNRVIFTRPGKAVGAVDFNERDYSQFVYVEYVVPPPDAEGRGQHQLLRRVYRVATRPSGPPDGNDATPSLPERSIKPSFFALSAYVANNPLGLFNNPNTTLAAQTAEQQASQQVVAELPADTDRLNFTVEHLRNRETQGADPSQLGRYGYYDPSLFSINITVSIGRTHPPPNERFLAVRTLSGQARVKSGE